MANRQQQADFLPSKALQPQQQIFDQYNAPKQFQAPRSELVEIGEAPDSIYHKRNDPYQRG